MQANLMDTQVKSYLEGLPKGAVFDLGGKVALVTGGGTGIGRACALLLAKYGADVVIAARTEDDLATVSREVQDATGRRCLAVRTDLKKEEEIIALVQRTVDEFGRIDILVNNAGGDALVPIEKTSTKLFDSTVSLNLRAPFLLIREAGKHMGGRGGGSIINISSEMAVRGGIGAAAYASSKLGIHALTKIASAELGPKGVRCNCLTIGLIASERSLAAWEQVNYPKERIAAGAPLGRLGWPVEVAYPVLFLASDASSFMSGQVFAVDGGAPVEESISLD
ncbi:MAG: SDR family oxidoreductase [Rhodocyclaceae bacterium]|jgi:NAD(P)-dependent dehydrogenase (short-subunit alcohol dehydrogenase family)|nr:SDR family oxidoreductase [Rhodocyclaceae bacterium]